MHRKLRRADVSYPLYQRQSKEASGKRADDFHITEKMSSAPVIDSNLLNDDKNQLLLKCTALEDFRNSFPAKISESFTLYTIIRSELVTSAYSRWILVGEHNDNLWCCEVLRPDTQSYKEMLQLSKGTSSPGEIRELDMGKNLMWR